MHWIEVYLRKPRISNSEFEYLVNALEKIYVNTESLNELLRVNKFEEYVHPLFQHL